ncbi:hypothetical protein LSAT2_030548 [Lamellibrachia satsuma]|nr:hypothetical protein LSAT2_030548 [Lamellibrachia satsuma]
MDTGFIAGLVFAVGFMELVNLLYVKGSLPDFLRVAAGAFPFSAFLDVLIFLLFADYLPVTAGSNLQEAASLSLSLALVYAIIHGEKTAVDFKGFGQLFAHIIYVFLLIFAMYLGKHTGEYLLK